MNYLTHIIKQIKDRNYGEEFSITDLKEVFREGFKYAIFNQGFFEVGRLETLEEFNLIKEKLNKFWDNNKQFLFEPVNSTTIKRIEDTFNLTHEDDYICLIEILENYDYLRFKIYSLENCVIYKYLFNVRTTEIN